MDEIEDKRQVEYESQCWAVKVNKKKFKGMQCKQKFSSCGHAVSKSIEEMERRAMEIMESREVRKMEVNIIEGKSNMCGMMFHVTDAKGLLASVGKIVEAGNTVVFGKGKAGSYIENDTTKKRFYMEKKRGIYILEVEAKEAGK